MGRPLRLCVSRKRTPSTAFKQLMSLKSQDRAQGEETEASLLQRRDKGLERTTGVMSVKGIG